MRTFPDRVRHTIMFEVIALILVATGGSWITGHSMEMLGALSLMFSVLAMVWNFVFNWIFDHWDKRFRGLAKRGVLLRIVHASLFESVLLIAGIFLVSWWLGITYLQAFLLDLSFSAFFLVFAFAYNWTYDVVFPVPSEA